MTNNDSQNYVESLLAEIEHYLRKIIAISDQLKELGWSEGELKQIIEDTRDAYRAAR